MPSILEISLLALLLVAGLIAYGAKGRGV